ncbi:MAG: hypothetical protein AAF569_00920 [Pseudomonadota bacterium]
MAFPVYAESDVLFIRAGLVQCGELDRLDMACEYDDRCCSLKDEYWQEPLPDIEDIAVGGDFQELVKTLTVEPQAGSDSETLNVAIQ